MKERAFDMEKHPKRNLALITACIVKRLREEHLLCTKVLHQPMYTKLAGETVLAVLVEQGCTKRLARDKLLRALESAMAKRSDAPLIKRIVTSVLRSAQR